MKEMKKNEFTDLFLLATIFFISFYMLKDSVLCGDDNWGMSLSDGNMQLNVQFTRDYCWGTWVTNLQNILLCYLPYKLGINLQDWSLSIAGIIKSIVITSLAYLCIKFIKLNNCGNSFMRFFTVLLLYMLYISIQANNSVDFIINLGFFRFVIPSLLIYIFLYKFYNLITQKTKLDFWLLFFAFICASSSEIAAFITLTIVFCSILYLIRPSKFRDIGINGNIIYNIIILFVLIAGTFILVNSNGFQGHFYGKLERNEFPVTQYFDEFTQFFYKKIIYNFYGLYFLLIVFMYFQYKKVSTFKLLFPIFIILSCWLFCFLLIILGKTSYNNYFWLDHYDIYTIIVPVLALAILISFCNFLSTSNEMVKKYIGILILITVFILFFPFINNVKIIKNELKDTKNYIYLIDKITLFSHYKNDSTELWLPHFRYMNKGYRQGMVECYYYPIVYKLNAKINIKNEVFVSKNEVIERFKELGGLIDEIEQNKIKFSNLENKDFVLSNN